MLLLILTQLFDTVTVEKIVWSYNNKVNRTIKRSEKRHEDVAGNKLNCNGFKVLSTHFMLLNDFSSLKV